VQFPILLRFHPERHSQASTMTTARMIQITTTKGFLRWVAMVACHVTSALDCSITKVNCCLWERPKGELKYSTPRSLRFCQMVAFFLVRRYQQALATTPLFRHAISIREVEQR